MTTVVSSSGKRWWRRASTYRMCALRSGANARAYIGHVDGDRHFIRSSPGVRGDYRWVDDDFAYIASFDHVHTSIYSDLGDALPRIAASANSLSLDASDQWTTDYLGQGITLRPVHFPVRS
jgi:fructoselysine 6-kinase